MALILKSGCSFLNPNTGDTSTTSYMRIGKCIYDRDNLLLSLFVNIYASSTAFQNGFSPVYATNINVTGPAFTATFLPTNALNSIFTNAYNVLLLLPNGAIIWSNWQSDEEVN